MKKTIPFHLRMSKYDEQIKIIGEVFQEAIISIEKNIIKLFAAEIE